MTARTTNRLVVPCLNFLSPMTSASPMVLDAAGRGAALRIRVAPAAGAAADLASGRESENTQTADRYRVRIGGAGCSGAAGAADRRRHPAGQSGSDLVPAETDRTGGTEI